MGKTAFIFPGQGAQYAGMGKDFYHSVEVSRTVYEHASKLTDIDLKALCFEENESLNITKYTQLAILVTSLAMLEALKEKGISADYYAGLSLGEYSALSASGVFSFSDVLKVVKMRGLFMQEAVPTGGAMSAVLGLDKEAVESILADVEGIVQVANYNCPGQIVISGEEKSVQAAAVKLKEGGAKRVLPLKVSGPFHSKMLCEAGEKLAAVLDEVSIQPVKTPYITNVTAEIIEDSNEIRNLLIAQVSSPVRWQQSVERLIREGVDTFVEIGPGKTLTGFLKKIDRTVTAVNIETVEDLEKVAKALENKDA